VAIDFEIAPTRAVEALSMEIATYTDRRIELGSCMTRSQRLGDGPAR
jgi:hypothetical protein